MHSREQGQGHGHGTLQGLISTSISTSTSTSTVIDTGTKAAEVDNQRTKSRRLQEKERKGEDERPQPQRKLHRLSNLTPLCMEVERPFGVNSTHSYSEVEQDQDPDAGDRIEALLFLDDSKMVAPAMLLLANRNKSKE